MWNEKNSRESEITMNRRLFLQTAVASAAASATPPRIRKAIMYETVKTPGTVMERFQAVKAAGNFPQASPASRGEAVPQFSLATRAQLAMVDPPSMTMYSRFGYPWSRTEEIASSRYSAWLSDGVTMVMRGALIADLKAGRGM